MVDGPGQIFGKQVGCTAHSGGVVLLDLPAIDRPHAVHVKQQLHAGIIKQGAVDSIRKAAVGGVLRAEAQRDKLLGAVVLGQILIVAAQGIGQIGVLRDLGADDHRIHIGAQVLIAEFAQRAVIVNIKGSTHCGGVPGSVLRLPVILLRQLLAVAAPAAGDGDAVVDKVHRGQHMAEVDLLAGGQGDGVQGLQRGQLGIAAVDIALKLGIAHAGGQLPDRGVVVTRAGVGEGQHNGVGRIVPGRGKLPRQRLQAGKTVQRGIVVILSMGGQCCRTKKPQQQKQHSQQAGHTVRCGIRSQAPPVTHDNTGASRFAARAPANSF